MTVDPRVTWPSAAITIESPRRTQMTVVERTRRPSPRSSGWPLLSVFAIFFRIGRTGQYIAVGVGVVVAWFFAFAFALAFLVVIPRRSRETCFLPFLTDARSNYAL